MKLSKYRKLNQSPSKGEVFTPTELVQEMLSKLPIELFISTTSTFLIPSVREGTFITETVKKLMKYGHSKENALSRVIGTDQRSKYVNPLKRLGYRVYKEDFLNPSNEFKKIMSKKFDVVLGNPPWHSSPEVGKKTKAIWDDFVKMSLKQLNDSGFLAMIHPSGWRNIDGKFKDIQNLIKSKNLHYLSEHNEVDSQKVFGVQSCFDWYILENSESNKLKTKISDFSNKITHIDITDLNFISSGDFDKLTSLIAQDDEDVVNVLYSSSNYETRYDYMNKEKSDEFKYPCVSNVNKDESLTLYYSNTTEHGHFNIPKLICGQASSGTNYYTDEEGEYGLTQFVFGIVDESKNLDNIKTAMKSDEFQKLLLSFPRHSQAVNYKIISTFRKDFWKEFI